jgi:hypothetical protein
MSAFRCKVLELSPPRYGTGYSQVIERKINEFLASEQDIKRIVSTHFQVIDTRDTRGSEQANLHAYVLLYYEV